MNLENLNLKKGLIRLFIVSIVGAPAYGFFDGMEDMNKSLFRELETRDSLIKGINNPRCNYVFNQDIKEPKRVPECSSLEIYSDSILKYKKDKSEKYSEVTELLIGDFMSTERRNSDLRIWLSHSINPVFNVLAFWFVSYFGFRILRWVYRGFKK
jgi:predicted Zn-ribbon and HTH transcriptional regulator